MGDTSIERKKDELIRVTGDRDFQEKVYQRAYQLTGKKLDAEDYSQEALARFISAVKNKTSLQEIEHMRPLQYVYMILRNMRADKYRKMSRPIPQEKAAHQTDQPQEDTSEKLGRQKYELLATQMGMSVEDIANYQQEAREITLFVARKIHIYKKKSSNMHTESLTEIQ